MKIGDKVIAKDVGFEVDWRLPGSKGTVIGRHRYAPGFWLVEYDSPIPRGHDGYGLATAVAEANRGFFEKDVSVEVEKDE